MQTRDELPSRNFDHLSCSTARPSTASSRPVCFQSGTWGAMLQVTCLRATDVGSAGSSKPTDVLRRNTHTYLCFFKCAYMRQTSRDTQTVYQYIYIDLCRHVCVNSSLCIYNVGVSTYIYKSMIAISICILICIYINISSRYIYIYISVHTLYYMIQHASNRNLK